MKKIILAFCALLSFSALADFDRSNPADLAALHSELTLDPALVGYNLLAPIPQTLALLNDPANNPGSETVNQTLTTGVLLTVMVVDDFDAPQVTDGERRYIEAFMNRDFDTVIEPWRAQIRAAFRVNSPTVTNIDALSRPLSRAEVLFGAGTVIQRLDFIEARDFQP